MEVELWILWRLVVAIILGGLIGYEREMTGKEAGLRTHMLVALGSTLFVSFTDLFFHDAALIAPPPPAGNLRLQIDPIGIVEAVVTGISFLGAGMIFVSRRNAEVRGLTTAASVWVTAAVGIAVGLDRYILALGTTILIVLILHVLNRVVKFPPKAAQE
jgi:putative Mg2+ transporter-C (MgtC) family protein